MKTYNKLAVVITSLLLSLTMIKVNSASAITVHTSDFINNSERSNFNGLEGLPNVNNYSSIYTENGITVQQINGDQNDIWTSYLFSGSEGGRTWYANGGDYGFTKITKQNNSNFDSIGMLVGSGYGQSPITYAYNLLQNGISIFSGTFFSNTLPNYLGFSGGGFNEVQLGAYYGNNPNQTLTGFQALAIDSIELSNSSKSVPESSSMLGLLAFGTISISSALNNRRKKIALKA